MESSSRPNSCLFEKPILQYFVQGRGFHNCPMSTMWCPLLSTTIWCCVVLASGYVRVFPYFHASNDSRLWLSATECCHPEHHSVHHQGSGWGSLVVVGSMNASGHLKMDYFYILWLLLKFTTLTICTNGKEKEENHGILHSETREKGMVKEW